MIVLGFDPGGAKGFGCCILRASSFSTATVSTIAEAMNWAISECGKEEPAIAGIDTLLHWSDGPSGWRNADLYLKQTHPGANSSVMSPNSLFGAMAVGGVGLAIRLREQWPRMLLTETHPKVLFHALYGSSYSKSQVALAMDWFIGKTALSNGVIKNEHELDALISAWAAREGMANKWNDLCLPRTADMIFPAGAVSYFWPTRGG
ncbi:DUF429 domain-containing protein [Phyllobacterium sp. UNC302MFCol5.2]|uniref:DUF429 domain-containing protein n=1 Tax=Phyllobacterium sp. UNC302MFCol5.2 TaxID=1449065 RepID=UPI000481FC6D|nr:DUF429 domain-containing protein [Phyllobacterium sp. UNC302MFCol5.2]